MPPIRNTGIAAHLLAVLAGAALPAQAPPERNIQPQRAAMPATERWMHIRETRERQLAASDMDDALRRDLRRMAADAEDRELMGRIQDRLDQSRAQQEAVIFSTLRESRAQDREFRASGDRAWEEAAQERARKRDALGQMNPLGGSAPQAAAGDPKRVGIPSPGGVAAEQLPVAEQTPQMERPVRAPSDGEAARAPQTAAGAPQPRVGEIPSTAVMPSVPSRAGLELPGPTASPESGKQADAHVRDFRRAAARERQDLPSMTPRQELVLRQYLSEQTEGEPRFVTQVRSNDRGAVPAHYFVAEDKYGVQTHYEVSKDGDDVQVKFFRLDPEHAVTSSVEGEGLRAGVSRDRVSKPLEGRFGMRGKVSTDVMRSAGGSFSIDPDGGGSEVLHETAIGSASAGVEGTVRGLIPQVGVSGPSAAVRMRWHRAPEFRDGHWTQDRYELGGSAGAEFGIQRKNGRWRVGAGLAGIEGGHERKVLDHKRLPSSRQQALFEQRTQD